MKVTSTESTAQTPRATPKRSTQVRGEARRREILDIAMAQFAVGGFNSVSLADIAAEVGITQAGILHYFPTKAALLLAVLQEREAQNVAARDERIAAGEQRLRAFVASLADNDKRPEIVQLFVILAAESTAENHPGHAWFRERNVNLMATMTEAVRACIYEERLPPGVDAQVVARWLLALSHGLGAQWVYDTKAFGRAEHVQLFLQLLDPYLRE